MFQSIKNFLKRILPPPVNAFNREIERILTAILSLKTDVQAKLDTQRKEENDRLERLLAEQEKLFDEMSRQLRALQIEIIDDITAQTKVVQAELTSELSKQVRAAQTELTLQRKEIVQQARGIKQKLDDDQRRMRYDRDCRVPLESYEQELALWYRQRVGRPLNLRAPKTFNEKVQWLKLYDSTPLKTRLADKYLVKEWIKEKIGEKYLVPLLGVWDSFDEIDFNNLPDQFVLKANHGAAMTLIIKDNA